jgi:hypothetical protein
MINIARTELVAAPKVKIEWKRGEDPLLNTKAKQNSVHTAVA